MSFQIKYVYDLVDKISPQLNKIQSNIDQTASKVESASNKMTNGFNNLKNKIDDAANKLNSFGSKVRGVGLNFTPFSAGLGFGAKKALESAANFETLALKMEVLTGSAEKGQKLFQEVVKTAAQTPFELNQLANETTKLMGYGIAAEDVVKQLTMIGDVAAISGGDLSGITVAFGQSAAAGRVMTRDLLQFVNNGVPIYKMLSKTLGVGTDQIQKFAEKGKITFDVLLKTFTQATEKGGLFEHGMDRLSKTLTGVYSNLKDSLNIALGQFGNELAKALNLKESIVTFSNKIYELTKRFEALSPTTKKIISYAILFGAILAPIVIVIGQVAIGLAGIIFLFGAIASPVGLAIASVVALSSVLMFLWGNLKAMGNWLSDQFTSIFDYVANKITKIINLFNQFRSNVATILSFAGFDSLANSIAPNQQLNQPAQINQGKNITAGGQLDVNFNGLPKGSNINYTPAPKSFMNLGVNTVYAGG